MDIKTVHLTSEEAERLGVLAQNGGRFEIKRDGLRIVLFVPAVVAKANALASGWTRHGHAIEGMVQIASLRPPIARCGGPGLCPACSLDAGAVSGARIARNTMTAAKIGDHRRE